MEKFKSKGLLAKLALLGSTLIWGSSFIFMKSTAEALPVFFLLFIRFSIACIILSLIFIKLFKTIDKKYIFDGFLLGVCLFSAYTLQTFGIIYTSPGKNAFLTAIYCIIVPFLYLITNKHKPDVFNIIAALLCIAGIGFISLKTSFKIGIGDSLTMLSGFFYALHIVVVKKVSKGRNPILLTTIQFGFCTIFALVLTLIFEPRVTHIEPSYIKELAYLAFCCTAVALLLQTIGQKYTSPSSAALILSLESVFGATFSILVGAEVVSPKLIIGFITIFSSIVISETKLSFIFKKKQKIDIVNKTIKSKSTS